MEKTYCLTKPQQLIYSTELVFDDAIANIPASALAERIYDYNAIQYAIKRIVRENDACRIVLTNQAGMPKQYSKEFDDEFVYPIKEFVDIYSFKEWADKQSKVKIDPYVNSCEFIGIHIGEYVGLFASFHHIIADAYTVSLIGRKFFEFYDQFLNNRIETSSEINSYFDRLDFENDYSETHKYEEDLNYWKKIYSNSDSDTELAITTGKGMDAKRKIYFITAETRNRIERFCKNNNVSPYVLFLSALSFLIGGYTDQDTVCVGTALLNRHTKKERNTLGMYVNAIPFETELSNRSFRDCLRETSVKVYETMRHQKCVLLNIYDKDDVANMISSVGKYDVEFDFQKEILKIDGKNIIVDWYHPGAQLRALEMHVRPTLTNGYKLYFDYRTDCFKGWEIEAFYEHFGEALNLFIEKTDELMSCYTVCSVREENLILQDFNATKAEYPKEKSVGQLFEEQVKRTPDKVAVRFENSELTYSELDKHSNALAKTLRNLGVGNNDYVAIMAEKSLSMVVGLCGIIKSGAAYVPINPDYPDDRIQFILKDSNPKAILAPGGNNDSDIYTIDINKYLNLEGDAIELLNNPEDYAYVIYTSGTTGQPKGTIISHKNINRLVKGVSYIDLNESTRLLQTGSIAFDASTLEVWGTLLNGGLLVLTDSDKLLDCKLLKTCICDNNINTMWLTAALFNQMIMMDKFIFLGLSHLLIGGEKLKEDHVRLFKENNPAIRLTNGYGPTESTTFTTTYDIPSVDGIIPIGKPIENTQVYILNKNKKLCGIGMAGELCIAGDGLAVGYLNRDDLTNSKFVDNPYGEGKLYLSGDLARWLPDGNIEYIGRNDKQVKIHGFRIEPEEVESTIRQYQSVTDCVVIAKEDASGDKALYAYITSYNELDIEDIKSLLRVSLPDYMVPSYMMQIDKIPVTINGKLDARALPEIVNRSRSEYVVPETDAEKAICKAFGDILGISKVSVDEDFFELGGDSIKAIRIVSNVRENHYLISVKDIMTGRTPRKIAIVAVAENTVMYEQGEVTGIVEKTPIIQEFERWKLKKIEHFNQSLMINTHDDEETTALILEELVKHHDMLRAVYTDGQIEIKSFEQNIKYLVSVYDLCGLCDKAAFVEEKANELQRSMDLEKGSLFKAVLFKDEDKNTLLLVAHHIVIDGVSWRILLEDYLNASKQLNSGQTIILPRKTASFIEWAKYLNKYGSSDEIVNQQKYWANVMNEVAEGGISCDLDAHDNDGKITVSLDEVSTDSLLHDVNKKYNTEINDILLSALGMAVYEHTKQSKVAIMLESHGRELSECNMQIDRTIGWFTAIYPIVLKLGLNIQESIIETKEMLRKIPNKGIGFGFYHGKIIEPDITFNYLGSLEKQTEEFLSEYSKGDDVSTENSLQSGITCNAFVIRNQLEIEFSYEGDRYLLRTVKNIANSFIECLKEIISYCEETEESIQTYSDVSVGDVMEEDFELLDLLLDGSIDSF